MQDSQTRVPSPSLRSWSERLRGERGVTTSASRGCPSIQISIHSVQHSAMKPKARSAMIDRLDRPRLPRTGTPPRRSARPVSGFTVAWLRRRGSVKPAILMFPTPRLFLCGRASGPRGHDRVHIVLGFTPFSQRPVGPRAPYDNSNLDVSPLTNLPSQNAVRDGPPLLPGRAAAAAHHANACRERLAAPRSDPTYLRAQQVQT